jgi:hypothetical protein
VVMAVGICRETIASKRDSRDATHSGTAPASSTRRWTKDAQITDAGRGGSLPPLPDWCAEIRYTFGDCALRQVIDYSEPSSIHSRSTPEALATWVAIASINGGERQS